jgi:hypothetical protein
MNLELLRLVRRDSAQQGPGDEAFSSQFYETTREKTLQRKLTKSRTRELDHASSGRASVVLNTKRTLQSLVVETASLGNDSLEVLTCREAAELVVYSSYFEYGSVIAIVLNAFVIGIQTDYMARNVTIEAPKSLYAIDLFFCITFTIEILVRMLVNPLRFFRSAGSVLNIMDVVLMLLQVVELLVSALGSYTDDIRPRRFENLNFYVLRLIRIVRIVRVAKTLRLLRIVGEIRSIIWSVGTSLRPLLGAIMILVLLIYISSVYLTELATQQRHHHRDTDTYHALRNLDSLGDCMLTLYHIITGGRDWALVSEDLVKGGLPLAGHVFIPLFVAFTFLAVMNVITGVFVESAFQKSKVDKENYTVAYVRSLFLKTDIVQSGEITWKQFKSQLKTQDMQELFRSIDLDVSEAKGVFHLLDLNGNGLINADEFLSGCLRLRGQAKALDLLLLMREMRRMFSICFEEMRDCRSILQYIYEEDYGDDECDEDNSEDLFDDGPERLESLLEADSQSSSNYMAVQSARLAEAIEETSLSVEDVVQ